MAEVGGKFDFEILKGKSLELDFEFTNDDGSPMDVSTFQFYMPVNLKGTEDQKIEFIDSDFETVAINKRKLIKSGLETDLFSAGIFSYPLKVTFPNGDYEVWVKGNCTVKSQY